MKFDVARALSRPIVMLGGEEDALRLQALNELVAAASGGDDFDLEYFSGDSSSPMQWIAACGTAPFLSPRRVAVVRHLLRNEDSAGLAGVSLPETALLILVADEEAGSDDRKFVTRANAWAKAVDKEGIVIKFTIDAKAFESYIQQAANGKKLTHGATEAFKEMTAQNLSHALGEMDKVLLYVGDAPQISEQDVRAVVVPSREYNVFSLVDAILGAKGGAALEQLRTLVGSNPRVEGPVMREVLPALSRQFRLLWQARTLLDGRGSLTTIPKIVSDQFPSQQSLLTQKEYPQRLAMRGAEKLTLNQIGQCLDVLVMAECRMKGLEPSFSTQDALEMMVLELVGAVSSQR